MSIVPVDSCFLTDRGRTVTEESVNRIRANGLTSLGADATCCRTLSSQSAGGYFVYFKCRGSLVLTESRGSVKAWMTDFSFYQRHFSDGIQGPRFTFSYCTIFRTIRAL